MARDRSLKVSRAPTGAPEIFASIQGEGVTCGLPSIFVRLAVCNLRCTWCDTAYTWDWARFDVRQAIIELRADDVVSLVGNLAASDEHGAHRIQNVVLTGGEPLLQQEALCDVASALKARDMRIEVETNATVVPLPALIDLVDQWNVSPKLASSGNSESSRAIAPAMAAFADQESAYFKFVLVRPEDVGEVDVLARRYSVSPDRIILMPEGTSSETIVERSRWIEERCRASGYRLGNRLHVLLWGNTRGR